MSAFDLSEEGRRELDVGRELDAKISADVMGIPVVPHRLWGFLVRECDGDNIPWYSASMDDAFKVVEKMRADGWAIGIHSDTEVMSGQATGHIGYHWEVRAVNLEGPARPVTVFGETAALAICRCALASLASSSQRGTGE